MKKKRKPRPKVWKLRRSKKPRTEAHRAAVDRAVEVLVGLLGLQRVGPDRYVQR